MSKKFLPNRIGIEFVRTRLRILYFHFLSLFGPVRIHVGTKTYSIRFRFRNHMAGAALNAGSYETWFEDLLVAVFARRSGAFIDVGANIGQTLLAVLAVDSDRRYIAFEPQVSGCNYIQRFIDENNLCNHAILPIGLSNERRIDVLHSRALDDVSASLVGQYRPANFHPISTHVPVEAGDTILKQLGENDVAMIKIDVEGGELAVMQALRKTFQVLKPYVVFEVLPNFLWITKQNLDDATKAFRAELHSAMYELLSAAEYIVFRIRRGGGLPERVDNLMAQERNENYIAVPKDEVDQFMANLDKTRRHPR